MDTAFIGNEPLTATEFRARFFINGLKISAKPYCEECGEDVFFKSGPQSEADAVERKNKGEFILNDYFSHKSFKKDAGKPICRNRSDYKKDYISSVLNDDNGSEFNRIKRGKNLRNYFFNDFLWKSFIFLKETVGNFDAIPTDNGYEVVNRNFSEEDYAKIIKFIDGERVWEKINADIGNIVLIMSTTKPFFANNISSKVSKLYKYNIEKGQIVLDNVDEDLKALERVNTRTKTFSQRSLQLFEELKKINIKEDDDFSLNLDKELTKNHQKEREEIGIGMKIAEDLVRKTIEILMYRRDIDGKLFYRGFDNDDFQKEARIKSGNLDIEINKILEGEAPPIPGRRRRPK